MTIPPLGVAASAVAFLGIGMLATSSEAATCESLAALSLPQTRITLAQSVAAGPFTPPGPGRGARELQNLPAFCRVAGVLTPTPDSLIKIETWMPASNWNGKFMGVGNGGFNGAINYGAMAAVLARGYAVAATDTGHEGGGGSWALGHPEKQIDFGYRAVHEMTVGAKAIVTAFYSTGPRYAYWNGCSSGGKQGLKEAQAFPYDYDGIIAGAPANDWTHLMTQTLWMAQANRKDSAGWIPPTKYPLIHRAVLAGCDLLDGVKDGLLENPAACRFDPGQLRCTDGDSPTCLTGPQVETLRQVYAPARNARTGEDIFPGLAVGGELGWGNLPQGFGIGDNHFKFIVFGDPHWDFRTLDFDRDVAKANAIDAAVGHFSATDPSLREFRQRGGKLLQYHGWNDHQISPRSSINYYERVVSYFGNRAEVEDFYRLFMVPGMMHCQGGEGATDEFDKIAVLERWVEHGVAPQSIPASRLQGGAVTRTRPLCPYPLIARWKGVGSTDDGGNFSCVAAR